MREREFWMRLERRVTAEFEGFADVRLRRFWCDGLLADDYDLGGATPRIRGRAWCGASADR